jgi:hypothetical protein
MDGLDRRIMATIQRVLSQVNSFLEIFLWAGEFIRNQQVFLSLEIHEALGVFLQTHNHPTWNKVTAILLGNHMGAERDIILHQ